MSKTISSHHDRSIPGLRGTLNNVIFGVDSRAGRTFDVVLIAVIVLSVLTVVLESVAAFRIAFRQGFLLLEWTFTILFTVEYIARLYCARSARRYALGFFGIVDLVGTMPTYLSILIPGAQFLLVVRLIRILRVFRVLRLAQFIGEAEVLSRAIQASRRKIGIFIFSVLTLVVILGSLMYLVEGPENGFTSIPRSIYWAIVTLTTVGYGDISPRTDLGQGLAAIVMMMGYGIIAVPTGIVTVELSRSDRSRFTDVFCPNCSANGHQSDAIYCRCCGSEL